MISQIQQYAKDTKLEAITGRVTASPIAPLGRNNTEAQKFSLQDSTGTIECTMWLPSKSNQDMRQFDGQTVTISATSNYGDIVVNEFKGKRSLNIGNAVDIVASGGDAYSQPPEMQGQPAGNTPPKSNPVQGDFGPLVEHIESIADSMMISRTNNGAVMFSKACDIGTQLVSPAKVIAGSLASDGEKDPQIVTAVWQTLFNTLFAGNLKYDGDHSG